MVDLQASPLEEMATSAAEAAELMKTLSNPARLRILCALVPGPQSVGQLVHYVGESQSYVSGQLAKLRSQGIVAGTREGRVVYYALSDPRVTQVLEALYAAFCPDLTPQP